VALTTVTCRDADFCDVAPDTRGCFILLAKVPFPIINGMDTQASVDTALANGIQCWKPEDTLAYPQRHGLKSILQSLEVAKDLSSAAMAPSQKERYLALGDAIATSLASMMALPDAPRIDAPANDCQGIALGHLIAKADSAANRLMIVSTAEEQVASSVKEGMYLKAQPASDVLAVAKTIVVRCINEAAVPTAGLDHAVAVEALHRFASRLPLTLADQPEGVLAVAVVELARNAVMVLQHGCGLRVSVEEAVDVIGSVVHKPSVPAASST